MSEAYQSYKSCLHGQCPINCSKHHHLHSTYTLVYDHVTIPVSMMGCVPLIVVFGKSSWYIVLETGPQCWRLVHSVGDWSTVLETGPQCWRLVHSVGDWSTVLETGPQCWRLVHSVGDWSTVLETGPQCWRLVHSVGDWSTVLETGPHMTPPVWSMLEWVGLGMRLLYILMGLSVTISMMYTYGNA